jgi:hypothetical protein
VKEENVEHPAPPEACGCGSVATERNHFFTGKLMTARDFSGEQEYFLSRHRLHNRLLHGWGIVCGLQVERHPNADCANWVAVTPGVAIDCCGRELVLEKRVHVQVYDPDDEHWAPPPDGLLLYLQYGEAPIDCVPVLYHESGCDPTRVEPNRIREVARPGVIPLEDAGPGCWPSPDPSQAKCRDDCDDELPGSGGSCIEPDCPCGSKVPLALLRFDAEDALTIDTRGAKRLDPPRDYLTHIRAISWTHGGELSLGELQQLNRTLTVSFDRPLLPSEHDGTGINENTFVVQYGNVQRDLEFLTPEGPPALSEDRCAAVFTIDEDYFKRRSNIGGSTVFVGLKCDFLLDCHSNPVDGDHLGGMLPSGNGVPGGTFESWFRVVADGGEEY